MRTEEALSKFLSTLINTPISLKNKPIIIGTIMKMNYTSMSVISIVLKKSIINL